MAVGALEESAGGAEVVGVMVGAVCSLLIIGTIAIFMPKTRTPLVVAPKPTDAVRKVVVLKKFVTTKFVNLRSRPSTKASIQMVLAPNSIIDLNAEKKDWKKIKFTDHVGGKTHSGWIYGENIKPIN